MSATFINLLNGQTTTIRDLEATGNLRLLGNTQLKKSILRYYSQVESRKRYEKLNSEFHVNSVGPFLKEHWNTGGLFRKGMGIDNLENYLSISDCEETRNHLKRVIQNEDLKRVFVNHINFSLFIVDSNNYGYKELKSRAEKLIQEIEK